MDSLFSILTHKNFDEPPEASSIKKFVQDVFKTEVAVQVRPNDIVVIVPSAALASSLRMQTPEMKRRCQLDKKILIRIA